MRLTYKLKRTRETTPTGKPIWVLQERKGGKVLRNFYGTREEMTALKRKHLAANQRSNPATLKPNCWIKAKAVRVRKQNGRLVMDIKK